MRSAERAATFKLPSGWPVRIACLLVGSRTATLEAATGDELSAASMLTWYSKCHVTSNKAKSNLECTEEEFQTRGWVRGCEK
jgi:hypothetical protein